VWWKDWHRPQKIVLSIVLDNYSIIFEHFDIKLGEKG